MPVMNDKNLRDNRVVRSDGNNGQSAGTEQSQSPSEARAAKKEREKQSAQEGVKKASRAAGAAIGAAFGGGAGAKAGGKLGDAIGKSKAGQQLGKSLSSNPFIRKPLAKLNDNGSLDRVNKGVDIASANPTSGMSGNSNGGSASAPGGDSAVSKRTPSKPDFLGDNQNDSQNEKSSSFEAIFTGNVAVKLSILSAAAGVFFIIILVIVLAQGSGVISSYDDAFGVSSATNGEVGGINYETSDPDANAYFERVAQVKSSLQMQGKTVDAVYVAAVFNVLNQHDAKLSYNDMTTSAITDVCNAMFSGNSFNEDVFRQNLIANIFPSYLPGLDASVYEAMADDVFSYYEDYYSLIDVNPSGTCASIGSCVYEIKGFYTSSLGNVTQSMSISDLKVRLMECGGSFGSGDWNTPLAGEELIPFEQYILGVAYQEIGPSAPDEAIKAQMVAARSFSLARPVAMNNANGKKLEEENGQWILQLSSCVADQVYCNPDLGCSAMNDGEQYGTVRSGVDQAVKLKDPLPEDHNMRVLANETMGELLVNEQGNIVYTNYASSIQNQFIELANQGLNYKQILLQVYGDASNIDRMSCNNGSGSGCSSTGSTGPYAGWKQSDSAWGSISLGGSNETISSAGCLVTSVAMLIAKSGVETNVEGDFNPGTFVQRLNQIGGFYGASFVWGSVSEAAPSFQFVSRTYVSGQSRSQKLQTLANLLNQGYYVVAEVKGNTGQHWVAIDGIDGNNIMMMDPGSQSTNMWQQYNWANTSQFAYFRVS